MTSFLRFSQRKDLSIISRISPDPRAATATATFTRFTQNAAFGYTWTVTPTSLFEARLGFTHIVAGKFRPYLGGPSMFDLYGIPGPADLAQSDRRLELPDSQRIFTASGGQTSNPHFRIRPRSIPKLNYSWISGRHSLKIGLRVSGHPHRDSGRRIRLMARIPTRASSASPPARARASRRAARLPNDATSYNLADFIFGLPSQIQLGNYTGGESAPA